MTYTVKFGLFENHLWTDPWWSNFVKHCVTKSANTRLIGKFEFDHKLIEEAEKWGIMNMVDVTAGSDQCLKFRDEKAFTLFVLRWS